MGDGNGNTFIITLKENGDAYRSLGDVHGNWAYVNGEARVTWDDGAKDAIRKAGSEIRKVRLQRRQSRSRMSPTT